MHFLHVFTSRKINFLFQNWSSFLICSFQQVRIVQEPFFRGSLQRKGLIKLFKNRWLHRSLWWTRQFQIYRKCYWAFPLKPCLKTANNGILFFKKSIVNAVRDFSRRSLGTKQAINLCNCLGRNILCLIFLNNAFFFYSLSHFHSRKPFSKARNSHSNHTFSCILCKIFESQKWFKFCLPLVLL